jgi:hypothetical protein
MYCEIIKDITLTEFWLRKVVLYRVLVYYTQQDAKPKNKIIKIIHNLRVGILQDIYEDATGWPKASTTYRGNTKRNPQKNNTRRITTETTFTNLHVS